MEEPRPLIVRIAAAVAHLMDQFNLPIFEVTNIMSVYFPRWDWKKMLQEQRGTERQVMNSITIKGSDCAPEFLRYVKRRDIDIGSFKDFDVTTKRQGNFTIVAVVVGKRLGLGSAKRTTSTIIRDPETGKLERGPGDNEYPHVGETIALWHALDDLFVSPFTGE